MHRFLPLLLLFNACANDPLELHVADVEWTQVSDGLTQIDLASEAPLTGTTELLPVHEDLNLSFSFRATPGTQARLLFQGKYALALPTLDLADGISLVKTGASPGVWQDVELAFIAAKDNSPAIFPTVYLNGSLVYYQQELLANAEPAGALSLVVDTGAVEFKDLRYSDQVGLSSTVDDEGVQLNIPLLRYELYDLSDSPFRANNWAQMTPVRTGYINRFDLHTIRDGLGKYAIRFFGKLDVPKAGNYQLTTFSPAPIGLFLDDVRVVSDTDAHGVREAKGSAELSEGTHDFRLDYVQTGGWNRLDVKYIAPGEEKEKLLNTMDDTKTIATPGANSPQQLVTDDYPYLLRSFLYFPAAKVYEEAVKRTHVISVGEGDGPHYSIDLQNGSLLQMWRGDFADTHDMWVERGEPQVMRPLGATVGFDGSPQWASISDDADPWPDSIPMANAADFRHVRYTLDDQGRPTFEYTVKGGHSVADKLSPDQGGLIRELVHSVGGNTSIYTQLATAREITEVAPGEYALRGPGLKLKIESYDGDRLVLQRAAGRARLLAELPAKGHITYRLDW